MIEDHLIIFISGLIAIGVNKQHKPLAIVLFCALFMHEIFYDIIIREMQLTREAAIYVAYATIQISTLIVFNYLKVNKFMKILVASNLVTNSLVIFHYIIVTNFGVMSFDFHAAYNPIVWSLMITQLLFLLWIEKDVVTFIRKQGYALWNYRSLPFMDGNMRSNGNANRGSK